MSIKQSIRVVMHRSVYHLGRVSTKSFIRNLAENGIDALEDGKGNMWLEFYKGADGRYYVSVTDTGHGLVKNMSSQAFEMIDNYLAAIELGIPPDIDLEVIIRNMTPANLASLDTVYRLIGLSLKRGPGKFGTKSTGFWSFQEVAESVVLITRPTKKLADEYAGRNLREEEIPTYNLIPPTASQLSGYDQKGASTIVEIKDSTEEDVIPLTDLTDPTDQERQPLKHGTKVIAKIREGAEDQLSPHAIAASLGRQFSDRILGGARLVIVNRLKGEKEVFDVEPARYSGHPILERELQMGNKTYVVFLLYNPEDVGNGPDVLRVRGRAFSLITMSEFNKEPWRSLTGAIVFPFDDDYYWGTQKEGLNITPERKLWVRQLERLVPDILKGLEDYQQTIADEEVQAYGQLMSAAAVEAMSLIPEFADHTLSATAKSSKPRGKGEKRVRELTKTIDAVITDEYERPVNGIEVELITGTGTITLATERYGHVSFGEKPSGNYTIRINLDPRGKIKPDGPTEMKFRTTQNLPMYRAEFHVITDRPIRKTKEKISELIVLLKVLRPDQPWKSRLEKFRTVELNSAREPLRSALRSSDPARKNWLVSDYLAKALTAYFMEDEPADYCFQAETRLQEQMYEVSMKKIEAAKRQEKAAKRKEPRKERK